MRSLLSTGLIFMVLLAGCGWNGTPTRSNDFVPLTSIVISADASTIAPLTSTRLTATGNYSGLFSRDITSQVIWSSAAPGVAGFVTAAVPNRVTGQASGTALLTATMGNVSATFNLTVSSATITGLTITPLAPSVNLGLSRQFSAIGSFSDSTSQDLTFDVDWLSSTPAVATVSNAAASKGLAQTVALGNTTISATFAGVSSSTLLTVTPPVLQAITISPVNPTMLTLSQTAFTAIGSYSNGSTADITGQVAWSSTSSDIATVSATGTVKALAVGTAAIRAVLAGITGAASLSVTGGNLTGISLSPLNPRLVKDTTAQLSARGTFSNGSSRDISAAVDWTVANESSATVTTPGGNLALLNALATNAGTTITASSGQVRVETGLTVTAPQLRDITIAPTSLEQTAGTSDQLSVTALFSDGSSQDITLNCDWTSDAATIATVGNSGTARGRVSAVANGSANISASYGGITKKTTTTVRSRTLRDLIISGTSNAVIGNQVPLTATANYTDGTTKDVTDRTDWSIDKTGVAALADPVNQPGQIVMIDSGTATLTASFGNQSKTVTLTSRGF